ncbi:hypothetical protein C8R43DRAFT_960554 [Mycena crocata]|nr:hypothetical protein C8R43DRAFT_960554 [Mycena crocata]
MQSLLPCLLALVILFAFLAAAWFPGSSELKTLNDEIAYQQTEITQLEKLVKKRRPFEEEVERLYTVAYHYQENAVDLAAEVDLLADRQTQVEDMAKSKIKALSAELEDQKTYTQQLTARYDAECGESAMVKAMNWALEREVEELRKIVADLQRTAQDTEKQKSILEAGQMAVIKTLKEHVKTAAKRSIDQETRIRLLTEQVAEKEKENEEVAILAEELAIQSQAACDTQRRRNKEYVGNMKKKWAVAWNWAADEMEEMKARLGELASGGQDDSFISMADLFDEDETAQEEMEEVDMSICSVLQDVAELSPASPQRPVKPTTLPWVPSPSKTLAGRLLVRKIALSANPPDSPFAFATNSVRFAPADGKYTKDRSAKRVKVDRAMKEEGEE